MTKLTVKEAEIIYRNLATESAERIKEAIDLFSTYDDKFQAKIVECNKRLHEIEYVQMDLFSDDGTTLTYKDDDTGKTVEVSKVDIDIRYKKAIAIARSFLAVAWADKDLEPFFNINISVNKKAFEEAKSKGELPPALDRLASAKVQPSLFVLKEKLDKDGE